MLKGYKIIVELEEGLALLNLKFRDLSLSDVEKRSIQKKIIALKEIEAYINSYRWVDNNLKVIERIELIRKCNYDYKLIINEFNMTSDALKSFIYRTNRKLEMSIGEKTIDYILSPDDKVALGLVNFRFLSGVYTLDNILLNDVVALLPAKAFSFLDMSECLEEIRYLYDYSLFSMANRLKKLDMQKLSYLRYVLESDTERNIKDKRDLATVLLGVNKSIDDYIEELTCSPI